MTEFEFLKVCRDASILLGLEDVDALPTCAWVDSERVAVLYDEGFDDGAYICIDAGCVDATSGARELFRDLLSVNLELSPERGESFCLDDESEHIIYRAFLQVEELSAELLAGEIRTYVSLIRELRTGPLSACIRPASE